MWHFREKYGSEEPRFSKIEVRPSNYLKFLETEDVLVFRVEEIDYFFLVT